MGERAYERNERAKGAERVSVVSGASDRATEWSVNEVIRPKSRASAFSEIVGQTDQQTKTFKKTFE